MPRIAVVGAIGGWSSEQLADSVARHTGFRLLVDMSRVGLDLANGSLWYQGLDLATLDGVIIKKVGSRYSPDLLDRLEMLRFMNERGLPVFSKPLHIMRVLDRLSCTVSLCNGQIPMPPTVITEDIEYAVQTVETFGCAIFKPLYSSKAQGMIVVTAGATARTAIERFKAGNRIMYIQQQIDLGHRDLGVVFLGGNYLTTYARCKNADAWNTTTRSGGHYAAYTPSSEIIALAQRAQNIFQLDFTCVDVAETPQGPLVFEVSAFGGFRGIQAAAGINAADRYVEYVLKKS